MTMLKGRGPIKAPLSRNERNPRYFADAEGRAVLLVGAHTWNNMVDIGPKDHVVPFDWDGYVNFLEKNGHNFVRLWASNSLATSHTRDEVLTTPWKRTGPGVALDGHPKLDLQSLDPAYFARLYRRLADAQARGIYVSVMLFENYTSFRPNSGSLERHMFAAESNINGIDVVRSETNGLLAGWIGQAQPEILEIQKNYVRAVVETVADLDNVLFEICNEGGVQSQPWQESLTRYIRDLEAGSRRRHPIGQTGGMGTSNKLMGESSADWVAPDAWSIDGPANGYLSGHYTFGTGPGDRGDRPVVLDTDHLWGVGGDVSWVWKSFCRGYNLLYMDPWNDQPSAFFDNPLWPNAHADNAVRVELGAVREVSEWLDLTAALPMNGAASSGYCLGEVGRRYVAYFPGGGEVTMELPQGTWRVTWRDPCNGEQSVSKSIAMRVAGTMRLERPSNHAFVALVEAEE